MLFQPTNIIPDTRTGIGFGVVDVSMSMQVSWQVNGDYPVMTAFKIVIYDNNAASTQRYTTGNTPLTVGCPFAGRNELGEVEFFTYTIPSSTLSSAGITNGNEYKMVITQYYTEGNTQASITQSSASVFITRATPSLSWQCVSNVASPIFTFDFQLPGTQEHLDWVQYKITPFAGSEAVFDSGEIYSPASYSFTCNTLAPDTYYSIYANGQTLNGVAVESSGSFRTSAPNGAISGEFTVTYAPGHDAVFLDFTQVYEAEQTTDFDALAVYRERDGDPVWEMVDPFCNSYYLVDYGIPNGTGPYRYHVFGIVDEDTTTTPPTPAHIVTQGLVSGDISPCRSFWSILVCNPITSQGMQIMYMNKEYRFANNLNASGFTNNNEPNVMKNFTPLPTVQMSPSNYKSGSLAALIGKVDMGQYGGDTYDLREELMALSTSQSGLFLKSPKGDVFEIAINGPVSVELSSGIKGQPQSVSVPWIEIDNSPVSIITYQRDWDN